MRLPRLAIVVVLVLAGCMSPPPPLPPAPSGIQRISVQEPQNRTGLALTVDDPGWLGRLVDQRRSNVPGVLATELRAELSRRGFKVVDPGGPAPALRTEIRRWEPYSADYSMVTVDVAASLVDPDSGRAIWSAERSGWRVPTRDARSSREASLAASTAIAEALVEDWQPAVPAPTPESVP
jgi:hypothetical protein